MTPPNPAPANTVASDGLEELASHALRESEEHLRLIVSQATVGISQIDMSGRVLFANRKLCEILGLDEEAMVGRFARDILPIADWEEAGQPFGRLIQSSGPFETERSFLRHKDGQTIWIALSAAVTRDPEGNPRSVLICVTDITQRVESQKLLTDALREAEKAREEIQAAVTAKDRFLAMLSHELRTPLTPVLMTLGSLKRRSDLPARVREGLDMIERNIQIEAHFIDDLLDVTRIGRDKFEVVRTPMDVHQAIRHAIEISETDLHRKRQRLQVDLKAERHAILGDNARIQQVVWNVLKNASKFSPDEGEIRISTRNEGDRIVVVVSDSGIGIEPASLPFIFDPFAQSGENAAHDFRGLGLGLAIAKAAIDAHEGSICAESSGRGRGAVFTMELPLDPGK